MSTSGTQAVDRAAELLSLVVGAPDSPQFAELVTETGLAKSTAWRLLQALERHHLLYRDDQGGYAPGALFVGYAARYDSVEELVALAKPTLRELNARTGETVNLAVPHGSAVVQVAQFDSRFVLGVTNWVGVDVPPHCSALGKVCYAYAAIDLPARLGSRTPRTVTSLRTLRTELEAVRRDGYAVTHGELELGLDAVAVPFFGPGGQFVAAMGISGPAERIAPQLEPLARLLTDEATQLSATLGHSGPAKHETGRHETGQYDAGHSDPGHHETAGSSGANGIANEERQGVA